MKDKNLEMIKELSESFGPSGFEDDVLKVIRKYAKDLGNFEEDSTSNLLQKLIDSVENYQ